MVLTTVGTSPSGGSEGVPPQQKEETSPTDAATSKVAQSALLNSRDSSNKMTLAEYLMLRAQIDSTNKQNRQVAVAIGDQSGFEDHDPSMTLILSTPDKTREALLKMLRDLI